MFFLFLGNKLHNSQTDLLPLAEYLGTKQDSARFYPLCASCMSKVETVEGTTKRTPCRYHISATTERGSK